MILLLYATFAFALIFMLMEDEDDQDFSEFIRMSYLLDLGDF